VLSSVFSRDDERPSAAARLAKEKEEMTNCCARCIVEFREAIVSFIYRHRPRRWRITRLSILVDGIRTRWSRRATCEPMKSTNALAVILRLFTRASGTHHPLSVRGTGQSRYLVSLLENLARNNICRSIRRIGGWRTNACRCIAATILNLYKLTLVFLFDIA